MNNTLIESLLGLLAETSGFAHDIGKATKLFQEKLLNPHFPCKDPVRHEWVSLLLLDRMIEGSALNAAFDKLPSTYHAERIPFDKRKGIDTPIESLRFIVATHHGLFGPKLDRTYQKSMGLPADNSKHVRTVEDHPFNKDPKHYLSPAASFEQGFEKQLSEKLNDLINIDQSLSVAELKAISLITRAALILADHTVSSRITEHKSAALAANPIRDKTCRKAKQGEKERRVPNQDLHYHLTEVGKLAKTISHGMRRHVWPGLKKQDTTTITARSADQRFNWQNDACDALSSLRDRTAGPVLVLNVAGTGSGKTRMNAKALSILNRRPELRFSTVLNLRTLTLQTGTAYRQELDIPAADLQCVIGDHFVKSLYDYQQTNTNSPTDFDENPGEHLFTGYETTSAAPSWLQEYASMTSSQTDIITPAVLVSTIDFLIAAGDPSRQGHHGAALLRLSNSDIILDEIDDYEPAAFIAVLRMVEIAAMLGANIVASTATLPIHMAEALIEVYTKGVAAGRALNTAIASDKNEKAAIAIIGERQTPELILNALPRFKSIYHLFVTQPQEKPIITKKPTVIYLAEKSEAAFFQATLRMVETFHRDHAWQYSDTATRISIGLVRVANIKTAIKLAMFLAEKLPDDRIATYHARDFMIQRHRKEALLDHILNRKAGNANLESSTYIQALVQKAKNNSLKLIVVATPVEEVGRDHDFDWAVIEPSSMRSIVQTSGRINRHRRVPVNTPNIGVLNYNYNACTGKTPIFSRPGYEPSSLWQEHELSKLVHWAEVPNISGQIRFETHPLAQLEDESIESAIKSPVEILLLNNKRKLLEWTTERFYRGFQLRDHNVDDTWRYNTTTHKFEILENSVFGVEPIEKEILVERIESPKNAWLYWSLEDNLSYAQSVGVPLEKAFELSSPNYNGNPQKLIFSSAFGAYSVNPK